MSYKDWLDKVAKHVGAGALLSAPNKKKTPRFIKDIADKDKTIDANLFIDPQRFAYISVWLLQNPNREISGFAVVQEGELVWIALSSYGGLGGVEHSGEDEAWAIEQAVKSGYVNGPNTQWHTHPGMNTYWSSKDDSDQFKKIEEGQKWGSGEYWFLCFDIGQAIVRKVEYDKESVRYNDGEIVLRAAEDGKYHHSLDWGRGRSFYATKAAASKWDNYVSYASVKKGPDGVYAWLDDGKDEDAALGHYDSYEEYEMEWIRARAEDLRTAFRAAHSEGEQAILDAMTLEIDTWSFWKDEAAMLVETLREMNAEGVANAFSTAYYDMGYFTVVDEPWGEASFSPIPTAAEVISAYDQGYGLRGELMGMSDSQKSALLLGIASRQRDDVYRYLLVMFRNGKEK